MNTYFRLLCMLVLSATLLFGCQPGGEPAAEKAAGQAQTQTAGSAKSETAAAPKASSKKFPKAVGVVNDFAKILNDESRAALKDRITAYEADTKREVAVVTVKSIEPYNNIHKYATALGNDWGVGKADMNNGVVLLYCTSCQAVTIATGKGTEKSLDDAMCQKIINSDMIPRFRQQKAAQALIDGLDGIFRDWPI